MPVPDRSLLIGLAPVLLLGCTSPERAAADAPSPIPVVLGVDLGASASRGPARSVAATQLAHEGHAGTHAMGTVNAVDAAARKINLTHGPIPALGWPAMTMDFPVAAAVDLSAIRTGARVEVSLGKDEDGMYEIQSVQPAPERR